MQNTQADSVTGVLTPWKLEKVFSTCFPNALHKDRFIKAIIEYCPRFGVNTPKRLSAFLGQVGQECGGFTVFEESLNYSTEALLKMFSRHRITSADAVRYGRNKGKNADQQALANILYGGEFGRKQLGNTNNNDGWLYRGRGCKQLTGKANYILLSQITKWDCVNNPDMLLEPENGLIAALYYWDQINPSGKSLNLVADREDDAKLTKLVNGGQNGLKERKAIRGQVYSILCSAS